MSTDVTTFRARTHGGDDIVSGESATKAITVFAGAGNDSMVGGTAADSLYGDLGNDTIQGGRGNDTMDGGLDSDLYLVSGTNSGTDKLKDTGVSGVDRLQATSANTSFVLGTSFSATSSGLEEISSAGLAGFKLLGTSGIDSHNLANIVVEGAVTWEGLANSDTLIGSHRDDNMRGGAGNDTIDGAAGADTVLFAGTALTYEIVPSGTRWLVRDTAPTSNGDDGTDTLSNVEYLQFLDRTIDLSTMLNTPPVAEPDSAITHEDANPFIIPVLANDSDANLGDTKRVVAVDATGVRGIVQVPTGGTGVLFYTNRAYEYLKPGESAIETFSYTMADSNGAQSTSTVVVTITGANDAPTAFADSGPTILEDDPALPVFVLSNDTDPDAGDRMRIVEVNGDGVPSTVEIIFIYGVGAPILVPGVPAIKGSLAMAADGQSVVYNQGNAFQFLRSGLTAVERFQYTISDQAGARSTNWATVSIQGQNDPPTAFNDQLTIGKNAATVQIHALANDHDIDDGDLRSITSIDTTGLIGTATLATDGKSVSYSVGSGFQHLEPGQTAIETLRYTITDGSGATSTAQIQITISGSNQSPMSNSDSAAATENGAPITIDVLANDVDADATDVLQIVRLNTTGLQATASILPGNKAIQYNVGNAFQSLALGATTTEVFTYTVRDMAASESTASVTVTITGTNDAPIAVVNSTNVTEDQAPQFVDVLANDTDIDLGDTKRVIGVGGASLRGTASMTADGSGVIYSPGLAFQHLRAGATANDVFNYSIVDAVGATSSASVTVTIIGSNDPPTAVDNAITVSEDAGSTSIAVLANDVDPDTGDSKRILSINTAGLRGTATIATSGTSILYQVGEAFQHLISGQTALETFTYTMVDAAGATSTAQVLITVNGMTDGPKAVPDNTLVAEDDGPTYLDILANDFHDQNPLEPLSLQTVDGNGSPATIELIMIYGVGVGFVNPGFPAAKGSVAIAADGRGVLYTPFQGLKSGETINDLFRYTVRDTTGRSSTAIVAVTLVGANDAPEARNDTFTISSDSGTAPLSLLLNDMDPDEGDSQRIARIDPTGSQGALTINADGSTVSYSVSPTHQGLLYGQTATESFVYTLVDSAGLESSATVTVTIQGANHAPVTQDDSSSATEDGHAVSIGVLGNDNDQDIPMGDSISIVAVNNAGGQGVVTISEDRKSVIYSPGTGFQHLSLGQTAIETFTYTVADDRGLQAVARVTMTITGSNDAPSAQSNSHSISEDAPATILNVLTNDSDPDANDNLTIVAIDTAGVLSSIAVTGDGTALRVVVSSAYQSLNTGESAIETFTYTISDHHGTQSTAAVTLQIVGANEPVIIINPPPPPAGAIVGTSGDDVLITADAADVVYGMAGDDTLQSGSGNDSLFGGSGRDTLEGGNGNDILNGGMDRDDLSGGTGADIFRYYLATESTTTAMDRIRDFESGQGDKIDLSLIDASTTVGGNNDFVIVSALTQVAGQLQIVMVASDLYQLRGDVNGDGVIDLQIEVKSKTAISVHDIIL